jgi:hypothetical protein
MQNVIVYWHKPKSTGPATLWLVDQTTRNLLTICHYEYNAANIAGVIRLINYGYVNVTEVTCRDYGEYLAWKARRDAEKVLVKHGRTYKMVEVENTGLVAIDVTDKKTDRELELEAQLENSRKAAAGRLESIDRLQLELTNVKHELASAKSVFALAQRKAIEEISGWRL